MVCFIKKVLQYKKSMAETKSNSGASQEFVPIKEIRDGVIVLKDESMRAVIMASSLNFALKSGEEQQSIIYQFQNFLNSLNFSVQIVVQSRRLDIRPYIALLSDKAKEQTNELMKIQTREYIEFIKTFTENSNIMTKTFYIVIPYTASILSSATKGGSVFPFPGQKNKKEVAKENLEDFEEKRTQLEQRVSVVEQGLIRSGIRVAQLGTEELVEIFYKLFNPGDVEKPIQLAS